MELNFAVERYKLMVSGLYGKWLYYRPTSQPFV